MKILPSHPDYPELARLNQMLCILKNPEHHHYVLYTQDKIEITAIIFYIEDAIQMILDKNNPFFSFINSIQ